MYEKLIFKAFRAVDDFESCIGFKEGHISVLRDYGITNITTNNDQWMYRRNMYCVVAVSEDGLETLGGIRIQVSEENDPLPLEKAVGKMDRRIHSIVANFRTGGGVGELCALWNSKKVAGMGISLLLTRAGISISNQVKINTLMGICGEYTLEMFQRVGFVVDQSLGVNGLFPYPKDEYTARVLGILNANTLDSANVYDKERIEAIRNSPAQICIEKGPKKDVEISYQLLMKASV